MNVLGGKTKREFAARLYRLNCTFKTSSLDLFILFKVVLFLEATTALLQQSDLQSNNFLEFIEPSSAEVSVTGNDA